MRLIGMLGGMSPESTVLYYRYMNEAVRRRTGDPGASARVLLHSVDFSELTALQRAGEWEQAGEMLAGAARGLVAGGAELVLISANTMHTVADQVAAALPEGVSLLHVGDVIVERAGAGSEVLLLGTAYTMKMPFLRDHLAERGVAARVPDDETQAWLQRVIYEELTRGVVSPEAEARFAEILQRAAAEGADAVVLGCTELGMFATARTPVRLIDTARAHAEAAVDEALAKQPA